ncbi:hypothetical protein AAFF_G00239630 [Aldrovandia affinis]|uniref:Uncharacterized protein n=1 Tax=Aldrovandia affinis TaxID=143900 RepID=A0AAD7W360_9TELE|nr:hypothetical protein AAFF_G00239630 [Aldrovandia affinis]
MNVGAQQQTSLAVTETLQWNEAQDHHACHYPARAAVEYLAFGGLFPAARTNSAHTTRTVEQSPNCKNTLTVFFV